MEFPITVVLVFDATVRPTNSLRGAVFYTDAG